MSLNNSYGTALTLASIVLASKITLLHVATARERIITENYVRRVDEKNALISIFKLVTFAYPGTAIGGADFIERAERIAKNCAENEPFFLALATIAGITENIPVELGTTMIQAYVAARCAHTGIYLMGDNLNSALRGCTFVFGALTTLAFAGMTYTQIKE